jgi:hypothetical protein
MKIRGEIDARLDSVVTFDEPYGDESYLLVVHPNDTDEWAEQELCERLKDEGCRGILLVKGVPRAGLSGEMFARLKKQYGARFHASACAVGTAQEETRLSGDAEARFRDFFRNARLSEDKLDWGLLDPQWPDKLVATYLLAKTLAAGGPEAELVERHAADWRPVWAEARREYRLLADEVFGPLGLDRGTAAEVAARVERYLQTIAAGAA